MKLTEKEQNLQNRAVKVGQVRNRAEAEILEIVQEVFSTKLYKKLGLTLHAYTVTTFKLDDPIANCFNSVAKKSLEVPELLVAVKEQSLTLWKACRIVSVLTPENASELIEFAKANSSRCIEREVARLNPKGKGQDRVRILSDQFAQIKRTISHKGVANLNRAESILLQKGKTGSSGELLELIIEDYLERHDPVLKAERSMKRKMKREQARAASAANSSVPDANESTETENPVEFSGAAAKTTSPVETQNNDWPAEFFSTCRNFGTKRTPLTAEEKHIVNLRTQDRCTFIDGNGKRCNSDRWTQFHHIVLVSQGGSNDPDNLTKLCSFHHDLVHVRRDKTGRLVLNANFNRRKEEPSKPCSSHAG